MMSSGQTHKHTTMKARNPPLSRRARRETPGFTKNVPASTSVSSPVYSAGVTDESSHGVTPSAKPATALTGLHDNRARRTLDRSDPPPSGEFSNPMIAGKKSTRLAPMPSTIVAP